MKIGDRVEVWSGSPSCARGEIVRVDSRTLEVEVRVGMGLPLQFHHDQVRVLDVVELLAGLDRP